jgi:hypothetical protein
MIIIIIISNTDNIVLCCVELYCVVCDLPEAMSLSHPVTTDKPSIMRSLSELCLLCTRCIECIDIWRVSGVHTAHCIWTCMQYPQQQQRHSTTPPLHPQQ